MNHLEGMAEPAAAEIARRVAVETLATRGVSRLAAAVADSVVVTADEVRVRLVVDYPDGFPLADLISEVRRRVGPPAGGRRVTVVVDGVRDSMPATR